MKSHKFLAANSFLLGTIIVISGYVIMFLQLSARPTPDWEILAAFFYTLSGILFWWLAVKLNPDKVSFTFKRYRETPKTAPETTPETT